MTVPKRFGILRFFGTLLKVIAWIVLVVAALGAIFVVVVSTSTQILSRFTDVMPVQLGEISSTGFGFGIPFGLVVLLVGLVYFIIFYVSGEFIHMYLAIEENTRLTAALLLRMHQEGQAQQESGGYTAPASGGFVSEPYE